jgi:anion-transporting  ArsA/GET3 family ATPase
VTRQSRIVIFCGKGGVGKTTLSLAYALHHAQEGRKVVVVSSHPLAELAVSVSLDGLSAEFPVAARNLFVIHIDPKELLADVVRTNFPIEWAAKAVLDSRLYNNLIEVAPGLKEFYFLARLQQLAERLAGDTPDYELLLWDAPSTGHFLSTLHAAKNFEMLLSGPLASAGAELTRFFSNSSHIALIPTTTLEEMAIEETAEMTRKVELEFSIRATALVLNLVSPLATATADAVGGLKSIPDPDPAFRFAFEKGLMERERAAEIAARIPAPVIAVERVRRWSNDLDLLQQIGRPLAGLPLAL